MKFEKPRAEVIHFERMEWLVSSVTGCTNVQWLEDYLIGQVACSIVSAPMPHQLYEHDSLRYVCDKVDPNPGRDIFVLI